MNSLGIAWRSIRYFLLSVDEHSLHSPFLFDFYNQVIKDQNEKNSSWIQIEATRKKLLSDQRKLEVIDYGAGSGRNPLRKISEIARISLNTPARCRLVSRIIRNYECKTILELGTSLGINTLYLSRSIPSAKVWTVEGCPRISEVAGKCFEEHKVKNVKLITGNIDHVLLPLINNLPPFDLVYFDANHLYEPTLRYYNAVKQKAHQGSIFIFDDIYWSDGMFQAWQEIIKSPELDLSIELYDLGIIFFKKFEHKQHFILR